jgi:nitrate/nitrite transport system substrate-binding protein
MTQTTLGFIALTDAAPLFVAKGTGLFAKYGMPDVEVAKQTPWGATRQSCSRLGRQRRRLRAYPYAMPYLISAGKVTQNNVRTPMYILAGLNLNGRCRRPSALPAVSFSNALL